ncbi:hypothetical protein GE09DRAFT_138566 [Coniochaeta sp. 2T2.1]|nr:hypothetical protein GE09DRAFT_138566 [Coniochaeta sp. 2T2.1]
MSCGMSLLFFLPRGMATCDFLASPWFRFRRRGGMSYRPGSSRCRRRAIFGPDRQARLALLVFNRDRKLFESPLNKIDTSLLPTRRTASGRSRSLSSIACDLNGSSHILDCDRPRRRVGCTADGHHRVIILKRPWFDTIHAQIPRQTDMGIAPNRIAFLWPTYRPSSSSAFLRPYRLPRLAPSLNRTSPRVRLIRSHPLPPQLSKKVLPQPLKLGAIPLQAFLSFCLCISVPWPSHPRSRPHCLPHCHPCCCRRCHRHCCPAARLARVVLS